MTVNIKRLDKDDRRDLNLFLQFFVSRIIREHTSDGVEIGKGERFTNWELPKNIRVSQVDLKSSTWEEYEKVGDDFRLFKQDNDLARKFQKEYDDFKTLMKAKSVKFR
tara:strand:+ start:281 stop:604 length:324 start_codon:yes stop_codon:yes gene_type:complete